jgi:hypothetical protein
LLAPPIWFGAIPLAFGIAVEAIGIAMEHSDGTQHPHTTFDWAEAGAR